MTDVRALTVRGVTRLAAAGRVARQALESHVAATRAKAAGDAELRDGYRPELPLPPRLADWP